MKHLSTFILASTIILLSQGVHANTLVPSLENQMKRQEVLDKKNYIKEKQKANLDRLASLRKKLNIGTQKVASQKSISPGISLTPKISASQNFPQNSITTIQGVDMKRVREAWFGWYNTYRSSLGLNDYSYDSRLDITAHDWNIEFAKGKGQNHHRRNAGDSYYDFSVIDAWFTKRGINPKVINRSKHTENVGYGYYNCSSSDCSDSLIESIRTTWNFFMSEKGKSYDAHYRSIINPNFTKMGFDIIVVPEERRYYITIHYITE